MEYHLNILKRLDKFKKENSIPNIIFYGEPGSGKRYVVYKYINSIYNNNTDLINKCVLFENCALGKGINFIRTTLKQFSKTTTIDNHIKIIVLYNADKLTIDAQSAMRRCIELFNNTTRFFIIIENIQSILQPILSRFCHIYVPVIKINTIKISDKYLDKRDIYLNNQFNRLPKQINISKNKTFIDNIYTKGYSCNDLIEVIQKNISNEHEYYKINNIYKNIKSEIKNENILFNMLLLLYYFRSKNDLENMVFM